MWAAAGLAASGELVLRPLPDTRGLSLTARHRSLEAPPIWVEVQTNPAW